MSQKKTTTRQAPESKGVLPKMELLIIFVFFMSFIVWAMSKCNSTQAAYAAETEGETTAEQVGEIAAPKAEEASTTVSDTNEPIGEKTTNKKIATPEKVTTLYVILDGLKLRKGPHLDSAIVRTLTLDSKVYFLEEVTKFKQSINLGDRVAVEPWIKVRAYSGHEGWVYGAGVHYFKPQTVTDTLGN
ncbi:MAG: SH3 domain-containing protein [Bacteroidota bacterium]